MSKDLHTLEEEANQHRSHAQTALSGLIQAISPAKLGTQAVEGASSVSEDVAAKAIQHARANPAGLALIGIGAALVALNAPKPQTQAEQGSEADRIAKADARMKTKSQVRANTPAPSASKMRKMLDAGLDRLPKDARDRVIEARLKAIDAQETVERNARRMSAQARDAHQSQPFATALAAAGIGALIGGLLPSTRTEGALLGAKRDQLLRTADAALRAEIADLEARGKEAVQAAATEGKKAFDAEPVTQ